MLANELFNPTTNLSDLRVYLCRCHGLNCFHHSLVRVQFIDDLRHELCKKHHRFIPTSKELYSRKHECQDEITNRNISSSSPSYMKPRASVLLSLILLGYWWPAIFWEVSRSCRLYFSVENLLISMLLLVMRSNKLQRIMMMRKIQFKKTKSESHIFQIY